MELSPELILQQSTTVPRGMKVDNHVASSSTTGPRVEEEDSEFKLYHSIFKVFNVEIIHIYI